MSTWKTKLFGDNALNFWGWLFTAPLALAVSLVAVVAAILTTIKDREHLRTDLLLLAIYLVVMGQFCLSLSNYFARVSEKLDAAKKDAPP